MTRLHHKKKLQNATDSHKNMSVYYKLLKLEPGCLFSLVFF